MGDKPGSKLNKYVTITNNLAYDSLLTYSPPSCGVLRLPLPEVPALCSSSSASYESRSPHSPFPFPSAQMVYVVLMVHSFMTLVTANHSVSNVSWVALLSFLVTTAFWSLVYIAIEI